MNKIIFSKKQSIFIFYFFRIIRKVIYNQNIQKIEAPFWDKIICRCSSKMNNLKRFENFIKTNLSLELLINNNYILSKVIDKVFENEMENKKKLKQLYKTKIPISFMYDFNNSTNSEIKNNFTAFQHLNELNQLSSVNLPVEDNRKILRFERK